MNLPCSLCSRKTDNLKLVAIRNREYLVCKAHDLWRNNRGKQSTSEGSILRVQENGGSQVGFIQPTADGLPAQ